MEYTFAFYHIVLFSLGDYFLPLELLCWIWQGLLLGELIQVNLKSSFLLGWLPTKADEPVLPGWVVVSCTSRNCWQWKHCCRLISAQIGCVVDQCGVHDSGGSDLTSVISTPSEGQFHRYDRVLLLFDQSKCMPGNCRACTRVHSETVWTVKLLFHKRIRR